MRDVYLTQRLDYYERRFKEIQQMQPRIVDAYAQMVSEIYYKLEADGRSGNRAF